MYSQKVIQCIFVFQPLTNHIHLKLSTCTFSVVLLCQIIEFIGEEKKKGFPTLPKHRLIRTCNIKNKHNKPHQIGHLSIDLNLEPRLLWLNFNVVKKKGS